ncbi:MAG: 4-alpha-glucanotransferase [Anaerolineae bacterium]
MTLFPRSSGVLLHPTSLPGRYGIGDLGEYAYRFADWLQSTGQTIWQVLPLNPTSYGDSPYQTLSAFAGNTHLISLDKLIGEGWLTHDDLKDVPDFPTDHVDYGWIFHYRPAKLKLAYERFKERANDGQRSAYTSWYEANKYWLDDWALFISLKDDNGGKPWVEWPEDLALSKPEALAEARERLSEPIAMHKFLQWVFYTHWAELKAYVNARDIRLVGDIPIFVAHDSADVWANRDRFYLDAKGHPEVIAGVPPDYFSETGQRWGNPLYRWDVMEKLGYDWWVKRFQATLGLVDLVRIDHFRGFAAYWEIPATEETAINGKWVPGPGLKFFKALEEQLGQLPIIAEDLGEITKDVVELRDTLNLPGMKILQFAWSDPKNPFLPHNHVVNAVVYSGTHDNNTTLGWWESNEPGDHGKNFMRDYLDTQDIHEPHWTLIRMGMRSPAHTFVAPMQDILSLGAETRMNTPGKAGGNWTWRFTADKLQDPAKDRLGHLTWLYRRRADQRGEVYGDAAKSS